MLVRGLRPIKAWAPEYRAKIKAGKDLSKDRKDARARAAAAQHGIGTFAAVVSSFGIGLGRPLTNGSEQARMMKKVLAEAAWAEFDLLATAYRLNQNHY
jgi:hypothetical protein